MPGGATPGGVAAEPDELPASMEPPDDGRSDSRRPGLHRRARPRASMEPPDDGRSDQGGDVEAGAVLHASMEPPDDGRSDVAAVRAVLVVGASLNGAAR